MIWADIAILVIISVSALISLLRGFIREVLSLFAWVLAFWLALTYTHAYAVVLDGIISQPSLRLAAAFLVLFVGTLLVAALVNIFISKAMRKSGLSGTDRMLGLIFGILRGTLAVAILVLLAGLTPLPKEHWWTQSTLLLHFQNLALFIRDFLPADVATYINYS